MKLEHHFKTSSHDLRGLFEGVTKLSTFCARLEKQAELDPDKYPRDKYVGDGFEFFAELFFKHFSDNPTIGVHEYHPHKAQDNGVDAYGLNMHLKRCAFQIKYRSNANQLLTSEDGLNSFVTEACVMNGNPVQSVDYVREKCSPTLFIFTTAKGLHWYTETVKFRGMVKVFGREDIRKHVDGNLGFWKSMEQIVLKISK
jgi:hypothetical protein